jgi:hypothetical protein
MRIHILPLKNRQFFSIINYSAEYKYAMNNAGCTNYCFQFSTKTFQIERLFGVCHETWQLTNYMQLSPSSFAATQELSNILKDPKVHYRIRNALLHSCTYCPILSKFHFNIITHLLLVIPNGIFP